MLLSYSSNVWLMVGTIFHVSFSTCQSDGGGSKGSLISSHYSSTTGNISNMYFISHYLFEELGTFFWRGQLFFWKIKYLLYDCC